MELTDEQRALLDGAAGPYLTRCVRGLVAWGRVMGARRLVRTVHTLYVTLDQLNVPENTPEQVRVQREIAEMAVRAGLSAHLHLRPVPGRQRASESEICAWTKSSAVVYANSILGARTTRHGNESAIAASLPETTSS